MVLKNLGFMTLSGVFACPKIVPSFVPGVVMSIQNRQNLTQRMIDSLKPPTKEKGEVLIMDTQVPGFGIRVRYTGKKSYIIRWVILGRFKKMQLCDAKLTSLEDARRFALQRLGEVAGGGDPLAAREARRTNPSVRELCEEVAGYLGDLKRSEGYLADCARFTNQFIIPAFGDKTVREVEAKEIERVVRKLKDTPRTANKMLSFLSRAFKLARQWNYRLDDPTYRIEKFDERPRERFYSPDELKRVRETLTELRSSKRHKASANAALLLMFTGSRPKELLAATWGMFDFNAGVWTKPSQNTKSKKLHSAKLADEALEILLEMRAEAVERISKETGSEEAVFLSSKLAPQFLFPSDSKQGHILSIKRFWKTVAEKASLADANLYDLRKTFATMLLSRGVDIKTVMKLTGHTQVTTLTRYYAMVMGGAEERALTGLFDIASPASNED